MTEDEAKLATTEQLLAVNHQLNNALESYQKLLDDLQAAREQIASQANVIDHLGYGMICLMQKHKYTQTRITLGNMRLQQNAGNKLDITEEPDSESVKFAINQHPFSYEDHLSERKNDQDFTPRGERASGHRIDAEQCELGPTGESTQPIAQD